MTDQNRLKIAIQKSGRLADSSLDLLKQCGIHFRRGKDQLFCRSKNFPIDIYFIRDDDIPSFVASNSCQIGIVGQNVLLEKQFTNDDENYNLIETLEMLGFGACRLSIAVMNGDDYAGPESLTGKTIATSYKGILKDYLKSRGVKAKIVTMNGAVEIAPRIETADAICDLVSTGSTLAINGLVEKDIVLQSQAVLIQNPSLNAAQKEILERFIMRVRGVQRAQASKYIMLHASKDSLDDIVKCLPGAENPTIMPLNADDNRVAVHAVCNEDVFWDTMEAIKHAGATSILVLPIEKMLD